MTERPKVHDWKSCVPLKGTEGSNPSLSVFPVIRNHAKKHCQTPPGPEGSNGKQLLFAP